MTFFSLDTGLDAMRRCHHLFALIVLSVLAACTTPAPPAPREPRVAAPVAVVQGGERWASEAAASGKLQRGWLVAFDDAQLASLVEQALVYNTVLPTAAQRVEQAAGLNKVAVASVDSAVMLLGRRGEAAVAERGDTSDTGPAASWEAEVWARVRYGAKTRPAQGSQSVDQEYARQSLAALVTKNWLRAVEAKLLRAMTEEGLKSAEHLAQAPANGERAGAGEPTDTAGARATATIYRDAVKQLDLARDQSVRALELLLGRVPTAALEASDRLSPIPGPIPAGLPSQLLERRPDIVAAERRLASALGQVGEPRVVRLPDLPLTSGPYRVARDLAALDASEESDLSGSLRLVAAAPADGAAPAQLEIRTDEQKAALADYTHAAQHALHEVARALNAEAALRDREAALVQAESQSARELALARIAFETGSLDRRTVQQQQLATYAIRSALLHVQTERLVHRVNLHLALGGGLGDPDSWLRDRTTVSASAEGSVVDIYRVIGLGGVIVRAPDGGWPPAVTLRLHGFRSLAELRAAAPAATLTCVPAAGAYSCRVGAKQVQPALVHDDNLQIALPPVLLTATTTQIEVRWAEGP